MSNALLKIRKLKNSDEFLVDRQLGVLVIDGTNVYELFIGSEEGNVRLSNNISVGDIRDLITESKSSIVSAINELKANENASADARHTHQNKRVLDNITKEVFDSWNDKSDFSGSYNDLKDTPRIPVVDVNKKYVDDEVNKRVSKIDGKSLSTNDFTDDYKLKLDTLIQRFLNS